jgi:hypothetical protein
MGTRFAGGPLHQERHGGMRTPGPIRTADLDARNVALFPLSYDGMVGAEGFEPSQQSTCFTGRPDSPASARSRGDWPELNRRVQGHNLALYR